MKCNFDDDNGFDVEANEEVAPKDTITWLIFFLWGVGVLLPWNAILSVFDYFENEVSFSEKSILT